MARRIRWQILIAFVSCTFVLALMSYLAITTAAIQRPVEGGDYVEALLDAPTQINPLIGDPSIDQGAADVQALIFDGLVRLSADGVPESALATSWIVDETGEVYTFVLRDGVRWHDGQPLTMNDVLFTIRAIQGPAFAGNPSLRAIWRASIVDAIDEHTLIVRLGSPFAPFLKYATFPILPSHLLADVSPEQWASSGFAQKPIGTGPYQIDQLSAERVLLRANPEYYRGRPFIDSIELRPYNSSQAALNDLLRGTIQGLSFTSTNDLRNFNVPRALHRFSAPLDGYTMLTFNLREGPLADLGLRRALAAGLDRDALVNTIFGKSAAVIDTPILPQWWAAAPEIGWYPFGQDRAATLLDDLGYIRNVTGMRSRDGVPLAFELITDGSSDRQATAQEIARQWALIGVSVSIITLEPDALQQRLSDHQFSMAIHSWQRLGGDPDIYELWHSDQADSGRNYAGLRDSEIDTLINRARTDSDSDIRIGAYTAFQRRWIDLAPSIVLYQPLLISITSTALGGLATDDAATPESPQPLMIGREGRFRDVIHWYLRSAREIRGDLREP